MDHHQHMWRSVAVVCAQIAEDCRNHGAESADPWGVNLTDPKALDNFAKKVLEKYGTVDILVNCAGIIPKSEGVGEGVHALF